MISSNVGESNGVYQFQKMTCTVPKKKITNPKTIFFGPFHEGWNENIQQLPNTTYCNIQQQKSSMTLCT